MRKTCQPLASTCMHVPLHTHTFTHRLHMYHTYTHKQSKYMDRHVHNSIFTVGKGAINRGMDGGCSGQHTQRGAVPAVRKSAPETDVTQVTGTSVWCSLALRR